MEERNLRHFPPTKETSIRTPPLIRAEHKHAYVHRADSELSGYEQSLSITIRAFGKAPTMKAIAYLTKNKWGVSEKIKIGRFRNTIFAMPFARGKDYLKCSDKAWKTLGDTIIMIRKESPE